MILEQAKSEQDWEQASQILMSVVERLNNLGKPLWDISQVTVERLKKSYQLDELYFLSEGISNVLGLVFLQRKDAFFWPEENKNDSLFIHKLAISPECSGQRHGIQAVEAIIEKARLEDLKWLRLDCDDRPELHRFYQSAGFECVDTKKMDEFRVSRYRLSIS